MDFLDFNVKKRNQTAMITLVQTEQCAEMNQDQITILACANLVILAKIAILVLTLVTQALVLMELFARVINKADLDAFVPKVGKVPFAIKISMTVQKNLAC